MIAQLGRQWAVFVYAEWENWFRGRVAAARGCDKDDVQVSVFGDLRLIRHDILHCGAVAKKSAGQQCEVLRWFEAGEAIVINERHVADFMKSVPWHDLREG